MTGPRAMGGNEGVASVHVMRDKGGAARTCLRPMRAELRFQNLGMISGVIVVDGVENLGGGKDLYMQRG